MFADLLAQDVQLLNDFMGDIDHDAKGFLNALRLRRLLRIAPVMTLGRKTRRGRTSSSVLRLWISLGSVGRNSIISVIFGGNLQVNRALACTVLLQLRNSLHRSQISEDF